MATKRSKSTRATVIDVEPEDRVSCLPGHVIDQILSHLPIRDAVRSSVLSNKWRYKWTTLPNLVFRNQSKFLTIMDHILLLHSGSINKFELYYHHHYHGPINVTTFDRWILYLTKRSIKELELDLWLEQPYKLPWCLFSCQSLHRLALYNCWINPPSTIKGFKNLKILSLCLVTMTQDAFENLLSVCPVLEDLSLLTIFSPSDVTITQLNIHAPNLKVFHISGEFEGISFEDTFQLAKVIVHFSRDLNFESNQSRLHGGSSNLLNFFAHLPHLQKLESSSNFLKYLAAGVVPLMLPTPCIDLTHLDLNVNLNDMKEISAILCFLRSSPNLQKLELHAWIRNTTLSGQASYCWEDIFSGPAIPFGVRHVMIEGISATKSELELIKFLLLNSPLLEQMYVKPHSKAKPELMTELIRFRRASAQVEVLYNV